MTGRKLYENALALLGIEPQNAGDYLFVATSKINQVLSDVLYAENSLRITEGRETIKSAPEISSLGEELPVSEKICREVMGIGLAAYLAASDDPEVFNWLNQEYKVRLATLDTAFYFDMEDVY